MEKRYVQHISGQGEKWEVMNDNGFQYGLRHNRSELGYHWVPKSEYRFCDPPEVWDRVTHQCSVDDFGVIRHNGVRIDTRGGFRSVVTMIDGQSCIIVERKQ